MRQAGWSIALVGALAALGGCGKQRAFGNGVPEQATDLDGTESDVPSTSGMMQDCSSTTCTSSPEQLQPGGLSGAAAGSQESLPGVNASSADAGTACSAGTTERCGPRAEEGACRFGARTCIDGTWSECAGAVLEDARDCTSAEDNDCDGQPDNVIDDVCRCPAMGIRPCDEHASFDGRGSCRAGTQTCLLGPDNASSDWGECVGAAAPQLEDSCTIAGDDADCDGTPNGGCSCVEGTVIPCGPETDTGICARGTSTCVNGAFTACQGAVFPGRRDCSSALDNDCDGIADDTLDATCACVIAESRTCGAHPGRDGNGSCRAGQQVCQAGPQNASSTFGACVGSVGPAQRDSCTIPNDDADCNGILNSGCQCMPAKATGLAAPTRAIRDATRKGSARLARATMTAHWSAGDGICVSGACAWRPVVATA